MATSDATWLDQAGHIRLVGQLQTTEAIGLPTGWTEDASDPANVSSNDGDLDLGAGELDVQTVNAAELFATSGQLGTDPADTISFYGHAQVAQQTGVAVSAAGIHAALVALGLITA